MKAVLISIRPKWVEKIVSGEKTLEVRKTRPKLETPFKCYIYCTRAKKRLVTILKDGDENYGEIHHGKPAFIKVEEGSVCDMWGKRQKIVGEFTCDRIDQVLWNDYGTGYDCSEDDVAAACLTRDELDAYGKHGPLYMWHISGLEIYDTPKELSAFKGLCKIEADCGGCPYYNYTKMECDGRIIKRPPQSWCYVEG